MKKKSEKKEGKKMEVIRMGYRRGNGRRKGK